MFSGEVSLDSSSFTKTSTPEGDERDHSVERLSPLETSNDGLELDLRFDEEHPPNFCIRDYVFESRKRNLSTNWPFSQKLLQLCLNHGVREVLPPFKPPETLESLHPQASSSPPADSEAIKSSDSSAAISSHKRIHSEKKTSRVSNVCPVCLSFNSPSNTTLNAHIDQCLSPETAQIKWRSKTRKMKSMEEICATAASWTLEDLDRRNGSNWAKELTFFTKVTVGDGKRERDGPIYVDSRGTKVLILSKLNGSFLGSSSKVNARRKKTSSVKRSTEVIPETVNDRGIGQPLELESSGLVKGFTFDEGKVRRRKRSNMLTFRNSRPTLGPAPPPKTRSVSVLTKTLTFTGHAPRENVSRATGKMDESQSPAEDAAFDLLEKVKHRNAPERDLRGGVNLAFNKSTAGSSASSPVSSTSTISHLSVEERETSSSSSFLEREKSTWMKNPRAHAREKLVEAQPRRFPRPDQFLSHHHIVGQHASSASPTLRLMGKNLTVTKNPHQNLSHPSILGFPNSKEREEDSFPHRVLRARSGRELVAYEDDVQRVDGSSYYWPERWGGSHEVYHGAPVVGDSRVPAGLLSPDLRLLRGIPWGPR